jgi:hypothetical protein
MCPNVPNVVKKSTFKDWDTMERCGSVGGKILELWNTGTLEHFSSAEISIRRTGDIRFNLY